MRLKIFLNCSQSGTPLSELKVADNMHPYIIAYGRSKSAIDTYYIDVEKHLIQVRVMQKIASCRFHSI